MHMTWCQGFVVAGLVTIAGIVGALLYLCSATGNDFVPPGEAYHKLLNKAHAARGQFLRTGFSDTGKYMKDYICCQARKWHIRLCPLCC
jgi:hypothetical protein